MHVAFAIDLDLLLVAFRDVWRGYRLTMLARQ